MKNASNQLGGGCSSQNSDPFKPCRPMANSGGMTQLIPYPIPYVHLLSFLTGGCGFNPNNSKIIHIKIIRRKVFQANYVSSRRLGSFNSKLHLTSFHCYPPFISKLFHFFSYPTSHGTDPQPMYQGRGEELQQQKVNDPINRIG